MSTFPIRLSQVRKKVLLVFGSLFISLGSSATLSGQVASGMQPQRLKGISTGYTFFTLSGAQQAEAAVNMYKAGARIIRLDISWDGIQGTKNAAYTWGATDQAIADAKAGGLLVLGTIDGVPSWALKNKRPDPTLYGEFCKSAADHYRSRGVVVYELMNEPNLPQSIPGQVVDPANYAEMLKQAYPAIKKVQPTALVITGGLGPGPNSGGSMEPLTFWKAMYAAGAHGYFDAIASHPYSFPDMPWQQASWNPFVHLPEVHSLMVANGDGQKYIWLTEYGAPTNYTDPTSYEKECLAADAGQTIVTEANQNSECSGAFLAIKRDLPYVAALFWFNWQDSKYDGTFGLLRADGTEKPSYSTYQKSNL